MTAEERLKSVEDQIILCLRGQLNAISCPYCTGIFTQGQEYCCPMMNKAADAILDRLDEVDRMNKAAEIAERAASQVSSYEDVLKVLR